MGKDRNATKVGRSACTRMLPPLCHLHRGELCDTAQDLMEEVASQMGMSLKMPFRFTQLSRSPFYMLTYHLSEHQWAHSTTPNTGTHYCIHIRVTLEEGEGWSTPTLPHMDCITDCWYHTRSLSWRLNHQSCGLSTRGGNPVLSEGTHSRSGLLYSKALDIELSLSGPVSWAGRTVQVEVTINTMQEVIAKLWWTLSWRRKWQARGPRCPWGSRGATLVLSCCL